MNIKEDDRVSAVALVVESEAPILRQRRHAGRRAAAPRPTEECASIGSPEKGGGPNLIDMLAGTLEVQGR